MKIDFSQISISDYDGSNVEGSIQGVPVKVSRVPNGWSANLEITIQGVRIHYAPPSDQEKEAFEALAYRAWSERANGQDERRDAVLKSGAFKAIFQD